MRFIWAIVRTNVRWIRNHFLRLGRRAADQQIARTNNGNGPLREPQTEIESLTGTWGRPSGAYELRQICSSSRIKQFQFPFSVSRGISSLSGAFCAIPRSPLIPRLH